MVIKIEAYQDSQGRLHKTREGAEEADKIKSIAELLLEEFPIGSHYYHLGVELISHPNLIRKLKSIIERLSIAGLI